MLLINMISSMLGQTVQEVRESQNNSTMQPIRENMNLVQNMSGEDEKEFGEIGYLDMLKGMQPFSLTGSPPFLYLQLMAICEHLIVIETLLLHLL